MSDIMQNPRKQNLVDNQPIGQPVAQESPTINSTLQRAESTIDEPALKFNASDHCATIMSVPNNYTFIPTRTQAVFPDLIHTEAQKLNQISNSNCFMSFSINNTIPQNFAKAYAQFLETALLKLTSAEHSTRIVKAFKSVIALACAAQIYKGLKPYIKSSFNMKWLEHFKVDLPILLTQHINQLGTIQCNFGSIKLEHQLFVALRFVYLSFWDYDEQYCKEALNIENRQQIENNRIIINDKSFSRTLSSSIEELYEQKRNSINFQFKLCKERDIQIYIKQKQHLLMYQEYSAIFRKNGIEEPPTPSLNIDNYTVCLPPIHTLLNMSSSILTSFHDVIKTSSTDLAQIFEIAYLHMNQKIYNVEKFKTLTGKLQEHGYITLNSSLADVEDIAMRISDFYHDQSYLINACFQCKSFYPTGTGGLCQLVKNKTREDPESKEFEFPFPLTQQDLHLGYAYDMNNTYQYNGIYAPSFIYDSKQLQLEYIQKFIIKRTQ